ncbi:MAG: CopD family protein [Acidobacteria bacterium]|nr:CopD family protein [Acidobacteriota bacterium]
MPEAATKAILYAALLPTVGASAAFLFLVPHALGESDDARRAQIEALFRRAGVTAAACVVLALGLRAWAQAAAAFGLADSFSRGSLHAIAVESRWGQRWQLQMLAAVACVAAYAFARGGRRVAWAAVATASVALCASLTLTGHAAGSAARMAVHATHLIAAGVWIGTLTTLMIVSPAIDPKTRAALFHAFSPLALTGAGLAAAAGLTAAEMYVGAVSNLWLTAYGRALVVKVACVVGVAACGYANWRRARAGAVPRWPVAIELLLAAAVVVVTAVLTEIEHP